MENSISLRRGLRLLSFLDGRVPRTFSQMREELGDVPGATLARLIKVLMEEGWVARDENGKYLIGATADRFARHTVGGLEDGELLAPIVEHLAAETGESAAFAQFKDVGFAFKTKREEPSSYHYIALHVINPDLRDNGFGFLCLAHQSEDRIRRHVPEEEVGRYVASRKDTAFAREDSKALRVLAPVFRGEGDRRRFAGVIGVSRLAKADKKIIEELENAVTLAARRSSELLRDRNDQWRNQ